MTLPTVEDYTKNPTSGRTLPFVGRFRVATRSGGPRREEIAKRKVFLRFLHTFGVTLGASWGVLGRLGAFLGLSWGPLGGLAGVPGGSWEGPVGVLGASCGGLLRDGKRS